MKIVFISALFLIFFKPSLIFSQEYDFVKEWDNLEKSIRDSKIKKEPAISKLKEIIEGIGKQYQSLVKKDSVWEFPVKGGNKSYIGGKRGEGFHPQTPKPVYDFYDGNKHGGHPAHDIFMPNDNNNNCIDDKTKKPRIIVAMTGGIVLSINEEWKIRKPRGGKYVWIYHPHLKKFFYYAHLGEIFIKSGIIIKKGDEIGTMGKTGFVPRVSCHLHMMVLDYDEGRMIPYDFFNDI